jgi:hypothetical protein
MPYIASTGAVTTAQRWEWKAREDNTKSIVTGSATTSGIVIYLVTGVASLTADIEVEFVATSYI